MALIVLKGNDKFDHMDFYFFNKNIYQVENAGCKAASERMVAEYLGIKDDGIFQQQIYMQNNLKFIKQELKLYKVKGISKMCYGDAHITLVLIYTNMK